MPNTRWKIVLHKFYKCCFTDLTLNISDILNVDTSDVTFGINDVPLLNNLTSCDNANINDNTNLSNSFKTTRDIDDTFNPVVNNTYQIKGMFLILFNFYLISLHNYFQLLCSKLLKYFYLLLNYVTIYIMAF